MYKTRTIVLASASPRRKEILGKTGLNFRVDESSFHEKAVEGMKPHKLAVYFSQEKARDVAGRYKDAVVIAADTIIVLRGKIYGKPCDREQATEMLKVLSGNPHSVITGVTVIDTVSKKEISESVESKVFFKKLKNDEIRAYVESGEPMDKAGAYGIQGLGAVLIEKIEGDFFNIMGLPLFALAEILKEFGVYVLK